jgi:hypothetical protein
VNRRTRRRVVLLVGFAAARTVAWSVAHPAEAARSIHLGLTLTKRVLRRLGFL